MGRVCLGLHLCELDSHGYISCVRVYRSYYTPYKIRSRGFLVSALMLVFLTSTYIRRNNLVVDKLFVVTSSRNIFINFSTEYSVCQEVCKAELCNIFCSVNI